MKPFIISVISVALLAFCLSGCSDDNSVPTNLNSPDIQLIMEEFTPDMNTADNIPMVCVIFSEAGLKSVDMWIERAGEEVHYKTVTEFYDNKQYSVRETPQWSEDMTMLRVSATDRAGKVSVKDIPISVIKYKEPPMVTFELAEIVIDETTGSIDIPITKFTVSSPSSLTAIEVKLFRKSGPETILLTPTFSPGVLTYSFVQDILYVDGDNALQVKATDNYGKTKIETLPISYIAIPPPVITPTAPTTLDPIVAASGTNGTLTFSVTSGVGVNSIKVYKVEKGVATELTTVAQDYNGEENINFIANLPAFAASWNALRVVAVDKLGRSSQVEIPVIVDLRYKPNMRIASQYYSKVADPAYPDTHCFFSVKDLKTYDLSYFYNNKSNIDMYFYIFNTAVRLYGANVNRPGEAWSADPANDIPLMETWTGRNPMKIKKFTPASWSFTFDNVTTTDLSAAAVQTYLNQGQVTADFANYVVGEVAFFQTSAASSAPSKIGIMRIEDFRTIDIGQYNNTKGYYIVSFKVLQ